MMFVDDDELDQLIVKYDEMSLRWMLMKLMSFLMTSHGDGRTRES
jgi:hypothetical protein